MVADLAARYLAEHAGPTKKPSSLRNDQLQPRTHVLPGIGSLPISAATRRYVARIHDEMRETPIAANRCFALVSKMMNPAERWGLRSDGSNPCRRVERFWEVRRERYLSAAEAALAAADREGTERGSVIADLRPLVPTGARVHDLRHWFASAVSLLRSPRYGDNCTRRVEHDIALADLFHRGGSDAATMQCGDLEACLLDGPSAEAESVDVQPVASAQGSHFGWGASLARHASHARLVQLRGRGSSWPAAPLRAPGAGREAPSRCEPSCVGSGIRGKSTKRGQSRASFMAAPMLRREACKRSRGRPAASRCRCDRRARRRRTAWRRAGACRRSVPRGGRQGAGRS